MVLHSPGDSLAVDRGTACYWTLDAWMVGRDNSLILESTLGGMDLSGRLYERRSTIFWFDNMAHPHWVGIYGTNDRGRSDRTNSDNHDNDDCNDRDVHLNLYRLSPPRPPDIQSSTSNRSNGNRFGIGLFLYQSMDAIDGKQARRTGMAGPLGEMFDHGIGEWGLLESFFWFWVGSLRGDLLQASS